MVVIGVGMSDWRPPMSDAVTSTEVKDLSAVIDRIYASVEQPDLWPETICAIGCLVGGGKGFWSADPGPAYQQPNPLASAAACHGTFLLSRADLKALDQYATEF